MITRRALFVGAAAAAVAPPALDVFEPRVPSLEETLRWLHRDLVELNRLHRLHVRQQVLHDLTA